MTITSAQVEHVARLARLKLDPQAGHKMARELSAILQYVDRLNNLNAADVIPTTHALDPQGNVLRPDLVVASLPRAAALAAAPAVEDGMFRVPRAFEV